jgi:hypothetical protein
MIQVHRSIGAASHAVIDYALCAFLFFGPQWIGFTGNQERLCWVLGAVHLVLTMTSRHPLGLLKIVGMPVHGSIELIVGVLLMMLPWIANFARGVLSRNFFTALGLLILIVWFFTDYRGIRHRVLEPEKGAIPPEPPAPRPRR